MLNLEEVRSKVPILECQYQSDTNTSVGVNAIDIWIDLPTATVKNIDVFKETDRQPVSSVERSNK